MENSVNNTTIKIKCGRKQGQTYQKPKYILITLGDNETENKAEVFASLGKIGESLSIGYDQARYIYKQGGKGKLKSHHTKKLKSYRIVNLGTQNNMVF